jgi:septum formation protein
MPARLTEASPLLLASGSPRRREILSKLRIPIVVRAASADESTRPGEPAAAYLERVVRAKLEAACALVGAEPELARAAAILVADTSVIVEGDVLGKPESTREAEAMIARLAGRTHEVWTRFAIGAAGVRASSLREETVATRVTFRPLTPARVRAYAESGEGLDKAGGYAVQGLGAALVSRIEGSYTNVVGLPACEVVVALEELGLLP